MGAFVAPSHISTHSVGKTHRDHQEFGVKATSPATTTPHFTKEENEIQELACGIIEMKPRHYLIHFQNGAAFILLILKLKHIHCR